MRPETHFNALSPRQAEALAMLAEEAGEIVLAVGKTLRHGLESRHPDGGETNREAISREVADLRAVLRLLDGDLPEVTEEQIAEALRRKMRYAHHQG